MQICLCLHLPSQGSSRHRSRHIHGYHHDRFTHVDQCNLQKVRQRLCHQDSVRCRQMGLCWMHHFRLFVGEWLVNSVVFMRRLMLQPFSDRMGKLEGKKSHSQQRYRFRFYECDGQ